MDILHCRGCATDYSIRGMDGMDIMTKSEIKKRRVVFTKDIPAVKNLTKGQARKLERIQRTSPNADWYLTKFGDMVVTIDAKSARNFSHQVIYYGPRGGWLKTKTYRGSKLLFEEGDG